MKKGFILGIVVTIVLTASITFGSSMISDVFISQFPILVNGKSYSSQLPILNYQGRTYLPLREFGDATNINVDFRDNTIIIDNYGFNNKIYFLYDAFWIQKRLADIDKNIFLILDSYISFLSNSDPYATANITNSVNTINISLAQLKSYDFLQYFKDFGILIGLDNNLEVTKLHADIQTYISEVEKFNTTITDVMYLKANSDDVGTQWSKLVDDYLIISSKLSNVVSMLQQY